LARLDLALVNEPPPELLDGPIPVGGTGWSKTSELIFDECFHVFSMDCRDSARHPTLG